jgi:hypothetical protein
VVLEHVFPKTGNTPPTSEDSSKNSRSKVLVRQEVCRGSNTHVIVDQAALFVTWMDIGFFIEIVVYAKYRAKKTFPCPHSMHAYY